MLIPRKLGLAGGIVMAVSLFICTVLAIYTGYSREALSLLPSVYPGYSISWPGAFIGLIYAFIDAFIGFYVLAWLYNKL